MPANGRFRSTIEQISVIEDGYMRVIVQKSHLHEAFSAREPPWKPTPTLVRDGMKAQKTYDGRANTRCKCPRECNNSLIETAFRQRNKV